MDYVLTGSVAFDYLMTFPGRFREHILPEHLDSISLSFLVDSMTRAKGGIAPNIAYTMALLGQKPRLFATVGEDFLEYRQWLEMHGVDTTWTRVIPDEFTASFFANIDRENGQIASFYPGAMAHAAEMSMHELEGQRPNYVVISPNDPIAMDQFARECHEMGLPYIYDPSQQIVRMSPEEISRGILGAEAIFVNEYEYALVEKATGLTKSQILDHAKILVVTEGKAGASIYAADGQIHVPAAPTDTIVDPTGVGDAFRGGFLTGHALGLEMEICGQMGSVAATYCLEHIGTQGHAYTPAEFIQRFRQSFDDCGKLEVLIRN